MSFVCVWDFLLTQNRRLQMIKLFIIMPVFVKHTANNIKIANIIIM